MKDEFLDDFVGKVFASNKSIRFMGITDDHGRVLGTSYRKDVMRIMTDEELEKYTRPWIMQLMMTDTFKDTTGGLRYLLGVYNKLFTVGIPVEFNPKHKLFVILSFDPSGGDPRLLIEEKYCRLSARIRTTLCERLVQHAAFRFEALGMTQMRNASANR